jgi:hypothetical protein
MILVVKIHTIDLKTIKAKKDVVTVDIKTREDKMIAKVIIMNRKVEGPKDNQEVVEGDTATTISEKLPTRTGTTQQKIH